jgi:hypothetical protein
MRKLNPGAADDVARPIQNWRRKARRSQRDVSSTMRAMR